MNMDDHSGWYPDPTGRHQERYFNAAGIPTNLIRNDGHESRDEDRVASAASSGETRVVAQRIPNPSSTQAGAESPAPLARSDGSQRVPVARYTAPEPASNFTDPTGQVAAVDPTGQVAAVSLQHAAVTDQHRRFPWLIAAACLFGALLIGAILFAVQQHAQADKWKNDYQAKVAQYQSQTHKATGLFVSLLSAQHDLSRVTFQKDAICQRLDTILLHPDPTIAKACSGS
jgi:hypothetical protein